MSKNRVYMIMDNDEFREVTESKFAEEMDISPEGMKELTNKKDYITKEKEIKNMEQMNSRLIVKYQYRDARKIIQQKEISISSGYTDGFDLYQVIDFMLSVVDLTGHSTRDVLLSLIEASDCVDDITDDLNYLGYGNKEE